MNEVKFWEWFTGNVAKNVNMSNGTKLPLTDSAAIAEWINDKISTGKDKLFVRYVC